LSFSIRRLHTGINPNLSLFAHKLMPQIIIQDVKNNNEKLL